jgi:hypothetical protein
MTHISVDTGEDEEEEEEGGAVIGAAAKRLLEAASAGEGLVCTPTLGAAVVWFHSDSDGIVDPLTWHGGAACLAKGGGKWTIQCFKSLPIDVRDDTVARAAYAVERVPAAQNTTIHFGNASLPTV